MIDPAQLDNELEALADVARELHEETWSGTVSEPYAPEVVVAHEAIADRLVAAGYRREVAVEVVAAWIVLGRSRNREWSVLGCVEWVFEHVPGLTR